VKGRQDGRISLEVERPGTEGARRATDLFQGRGTKGSSFYHQSIGVFGVGERVQPITKR
jgi:hypothetical protein